MGAPDSFLPTSFAKAFFSHESAANAQAPSVGHVVGGTLDLGIMPDAHDHHLDMGAFLSGPRADGTFAPAGTSFLSAAASFVESGTSAASRAAVLRQTQLRVAMGIHSVTALASCGLL